MVMQKNLYALLVFVISVLLTTGCSEQLDIRLAPEVKVHLSKDRSKVMRLTEKDQAYQELEQWLAEHQSGWYPTSGRYSGGVYLVSGDQGILITERRVVIYSIEKAKPEAIYVQEINNSDLLIVKNIGAQAN